MSGPAGEPEQELLRVELPFTAPVPKLINPEVGLHNLIARSGPDFGAEQVTTLLDAPDHRLLRSEMMLAHRVIRERGEWLFRPPPWCDGPEEIVVGLSGEGDLPPEIAEPLRPFRRLGTLGAVAQLTVERRDYLLRDDHAVTQGRIHDEKVTIRRSGLTTARFHEVTVVADPQLLDEAKQAWLAEALATAGGTRLEHYPTVRQRLGAPATGPGDFPDADDLDTATLGGFVAAIVAAGVRDILRADWHLVRGDDDDAEQPATELAGAAEALRRDLDALAGLVDPDWLDAVSDDLFWLTGAVVPLDGADHDQLDLDGHYDHGWFTRRADDRDPGPAPWRLPLRSERYLSLLENLVTAARASHTGEDAGRETGEALGALVERSLEEILGVGGKLRATGPDAPWQRVAATVGRTAELARVSGRRLRGRLRRRTRRLPRLTDELRDTLDPGRDDLVDRAAADAQGAFELGREYERRTRAVVRARRRFLRGWDRWAERLAPR